MVLKTPRAVYTLLKSDVTSRDHVVRCRGSQECGSRFVNFACQFHWWWHSLRITLKSTTLLFMRSSNPSEPRNRDNGASDVWALTAYCWFAIILANDIMWTIPFTAHTPPPPPNDLPLPAVSQLPACITYWWARKHSIFLIHSLHLK